MSENIRRFLLLTLSYAEKSECAHYKPHFVVSKCRSLFNCESVIVPKESHKGEYHVGILNNTASRYTATKKFREGFPEFEGRQLNLSFHKSWSTVCDYVLKQDPNPFVWGTTTKELNNLLSAKKTKKKPETFVVRGGKEQC